MSLYVVRHGRTDWNDQEKVQGIADIPLNSTGIEQAKKTKILLQNENIDLIISSPLTRTRQTAEIINQDRNTPIIYDIGIIERDLGEFEGFQKGTYNFEEFWSYSKNVKYKEAENVQEFYKRVFLFLDGVKEKYIDKNVLLVIHGGVSVAVNAYFEGMPPENEIAKNALKNCEVKKYEFEN